MAKDPYRFFRIEARELVDQLSSGAMALEEAAADTDNIARLLRVAHTLKGAARVVKQAEIADLAHAVEDQLNPYRGGTATATRQQVDALLANIDSINTALARLPNPEAPAPSEPVAQTVVTRSVRTDLVELTELLDGLGEVGRELAGLRELAPLLGTGRELAGDLLVRMRRKPGADMSPKASTHLREQAESLVALLAELERRLGTGVERVGRELKQAREVADRLRLIPVSTVFPMLERTCRDAAQSTGRQVVLETSGGDVLLDGQVLDLLQQALVQLVRNAVAHGIESPEVRRSTGKPERGRIALEVVQLGPRVLLRCSDDGRGIDFDAVRRASGNPADTSKDQKALLQLLLKGGISTAGTVTQLSGRGVGLDLVRETVAKLGGDMQADTRAGQGTTMGITVPVSLSAFDALLLDVGGQIIALPLEAVKSTLRLGADDLARTPDGEGVMIDGALVPLVTPALPGSRPMRSRHAWSAVVLASGDQRVAMAVDRIVGIEPIVLRALPPLAAVSPVVMGCCLDDEGNPRLVLDPAELVCGEASTTEVDTSSKGPTHPILVVDDSLTTRMLEQSILESAGLAVETAASAEEALVLARRNQYALFLVDVEMPGMDGYTFIERTRSDTRLQQIPSILVTSCDSPEHRARGEAAGAAAYIVKGEFDQADFMNHIRRLTQS
jgi:two-component system chemotaxis sensor kinase CheA